MEAEITKSILIVGAGQAGASLSFALRAAGYRGSIKIIGEEPVPPYERPPLSKAYLTGKVGAARLALREVGFYAEQTIEVLTGCRIEAIDRSARQVRAGGTTFGYDLLALATGAKPLRLPELAGGGLRGVHCMRTLADAEAVAGDCAAGGKALVVGGGYIGLEAAAVFRGLGMEVTLVEEGARILRRVTGSQTSDYFRALHRQHGVDLREGLRLTRLIGDGGRVKRALLSNGEMIEVDLALVGIGVAPDVALAQAAGLAVDGGIVVDEGARTSDPHIWAVGDCAALPYRGRRIRLESVQNAIEQAQVAAESMLGMGTRYDPVPRFWSDQYDVKLQIAGLFDPAHDRVVVRAAGRPGAVSHWYFAGDELLAVDAMNDPRSFMAARRILEKRASVDPVALADPAIDLKTLLPA